MKNMYIDRISCLPDEVLVMILDFLSLKQAIATSLLSKRWRDLWHFHSYLDFDFSNILKSKLLYKPVKNVYDSLRFSYAKAVDRTLKSHNGSAISEFRISVPLDKRFEIHIDKWLEFALVRNVRRFELDFKQRLDWDLDSSVYAGHVDWYRFPDVFSTSILNNAAQSSLSSWNFRSCRISHLRCLQDLRLSFVSVSGGALENLLYTLCPALEHLSITGSPTLVNLNVSGSSLMLKHLEILACPNLRSLEVRDVVNLVSVKYAGKYAGVVLIERVPNFVEAHCGVYESRSLLPSHIFSGCLGQIQVLTLDDVPLTRVKAFNSPQKLTNLKKLVVKFWPCNINSSYLPLCSLIDASPRLEKLFLEEKQMLRFLSLPISNGFAINRGLTSRHYNLKEVEFIKQFGDFNGLDLLIHILEKAVVLDKLIINTAPVEKNVRPLWEWDLQIVSSQARELLQGRMRPGAELVICDGF